MTIYVNVKGQNKGEKDQLFSIANKYRMSSNGKKIVVTLYNIWCVQNPERTKFHNVSVYLVNIINTFYEDTKVKIFSAFP